MGCDLLGNLLVEHRSQLDRSSLFATPGKTPRSRDSRVGTSPISAGSRNGHNKAVNPSGGSGVFSNQRFLNAEKVSGTFSMHLSGEMRRFEVGDPSSRRGDRKRAVS
jgi:hypothetical protein